jgi:predicted amidophosphoribosyltransferase
VPGIKRGEWGWKRALLARLARAPLPDYTQATDLVCSVPTAAVRRWSRGFDLAEEVGRQLADRLGRPMSRVLRKPWFARAQAGLAESQRRRLGVGQVAVAAGRPGQPRLDGATILLVDDVWTTGTTLLRCAQALRRAGAGEVLVLTLFRAGRSGAGRGLSARGVARKNWLGMD